MDNVAVNMEMFAKFKEHESKRILFRDFKEEDAEPLFRLRTDEEAMRYVDSSKMKSVDEAVKMMASIREDFKEKRGITWTMEEKATGKFMGHFGYFRMDLKHCRAEVGYMMLPEFWGRGFMTEAFKKMIPVAFGEMNFHSIEGNTNPDNLVSIYILEKFGFKREGYFRENYLFEGKFVDTAAFSLLEKNLPRELL